MTGSELAALPAGTLVKHAGDTGEIIRAGRQPHIIFPGIGTVLLDTESKVWQDVIGEMEVEE